MNKAECTVVHLLLGDVLGIALPFSQMSPLLPMYDSYVMLTGIRGAFNVRLCNEGLTASFSGFYSHSSERGRGRSRVSIRHQASKPTTYRLFYSLWPKESEYFPKSPPTSGKLL
jgi:hypothetical protein